MKGEELCDREAGTNYNATPVIGRVTRNFAEIIPSNW